MLRANVVNDMPQVDSTSYVDPDAIIIGRVTIGPNCFIGSGVVIRADRFSTEDEECAITIGEGCAIQDLTVLHVHAETAIHIGSETVVNHGVVVHGPSIIGNKCFIGCKAILNYAHIGDSVFVRSNAIVETVSIPADRFIELGSIITAQEVADALRPITSAEKKFMQRAIEENREYPIRYKFSLEC